MSNPTSTVYGNYTFPGQVGFTGTVTLPSGAVGNSAVAAAANIDQSKVQHRRVVHFSQATGTDATNASHIVAIAWKACTVLGVDCVSAVAASGGDKKTTLDVKKSTGGGAFSSILSATVDFDTTRTNNTPFTATLSGTPTLADGDLLLVTLTNSGSTGNYAQGCAVSIVLAEDGA